MHADLEDRRRLKTRAALHAAFTELLLAEGFDALKMEAVARRANVGRSTAYEHFRTKTDILRASIGPSFAVFARLTEPDAPMAPVVRILNHFREYQHVARVLLTYPTRPVLCQTLAEAIMPQLLAMRGTPLIPPAAIAAHVAAGQLSLLDTWIAGRPACPVESVAQALQLSTAALISALMGAARADADAEQVMGAGTSSF